MGTAQRDKALGQAKVTVYLSITVDDHPCRVVNGQILENILAGNVLNCIARKNEDTATQGVGGTISVQQRLMQEQKSVVLKASPVLDDYIVRGNQAGARCYYERCATGN